GLDDPLHGGGQFGSVRLGGAGAVGGGQGRRRRPAQFFTDLDVVPVLGRRGGRDQGGGAQRQGAQLVGIEPLSDSGQFRTVRGGAQRRVEDSLVFRTVLVQQVLRNAVHVHPP